MKKITVKVFLSVILAAIILTSQITAFAVDTLDGKIDENEIYNALYDAEITELREAIINGLITSTELTQYYLDRISAYNGVWNCFITLTDELALTQAAERDKTLSENGADAENAEELYGKLFGIPVVVKDNIDVEGILTTNGYKKSNVYTADDNALIVQRLVDAGAVIIGKTNMSTGANEARATISNIAGETLNAYNIKNAAGGSSGGTAVSVSLNFAAAGLGTDTNSSLRYPAVLNGCCSLRASRDIMDTDGIVILSDVRDTPGAITRTVRDQAIMLDVITGGEYSFESGLDKNILSGMRIGILKELTYATKLTSDRTASKLDTEVQETFANAVAELEALGAEVVTVSMSDIFTLRYNVNQGYTNSATKFKEAFESLLETENISAVIFPTYLSTPMETGTNEDGELKIYDQTYINNCSFLSPPTGSPEMSVLIGYHSSGSGIGMEICSARGNDSMLLSIAYAYTEAYNKRVFPTENGQPESNTSLSELTARYIEIKNTPETTVTETTVPDTENNEKKIISFDNISDGSLGGMTVVLLIVAVVCAVLITLYTMRLVNIRKRRKARQMRMKQKQNYNYSEKGNRQE